MNWKRIFKAVILAMIISCISGCGQEKEKDRIEEALEETGAFEGIDSHETGEDDGNTDEGGGGYLGENKDDYYETGLEGGMSGSGTEGAGEKKLETDQGNETVDTREQGNETSESVWDAGREVILGDERLEEYIPLLDGKRVALFSNHTGIVGDEVTYVENAVETRDGDEKLMQQGAGEQSQEELRFGTDSEDLSFGNNLEVLPFGFGPDGSEVIYGEHILDVLLKQDVNVTAIFSPEHGFRGTEDAGALVNDSVDVKTGVPILSLYGSYDSHYPSEESMAQFDTLVVDMQDVGLRYYTYYISLYYLMDACAAHDKEVMILDRPNPNGFYVDGPILQDGYHSGVGQLPIPIVHGMTWGELAQMMNGEGWLNSGKDSCMLTIIPCENYTHQTKTALIRNPSPNLKDMRAVYLYASTCFFENTAFSVGRGTDYPFEIYGTPYLSGVSGYDYTFIPESMSGAAAPQFEGQTCYGKELRELTLEEIWQEQINLTYLVSAYQDLKEKRPDISFFGTPDSNGRYFLDLLCGTDEVRRMIEEGYSAEEIEESWQKDVETFKEQRRPYLLYEE